MQEGEVIWRSGKGCACVSNEAEEEGYTCENV
jgi:hypothetical protein